MRGEGETTEQNGDIFKEIFHSYIIFSVRHIKFILNL